MAAVTIHIDFGAQENKVCHCFNFFPIYLPWGDGTWCMIVGFRMLSFKPAFSLSSFTFIKGLFSFSSFSTIRVVSSVYLRLLIFLLTVLILASLVSLKAKSLPAVKETWVQYMSQEDSLEKEMATHFSILAWKTQWSQKPGGLQSMGLQRVTERLTLSS